MPELTLEPRTTALIAIDLQNGIVSMPVVPHSADDVVTRTASLAAKLRGASPSVTRPLTWCEGRSVTWDG